jgi:DNA helicase-2/ATP-dependent DNA helicase PcrA
LADQALAIYAKARARGITPLAEWKHSALSDLTRERFDYVITNYERYKEINGLLDFTDMIEQARGELPLDVLFVDEAQDTSTAQWSLLRRIISPTTRIVIAGDDDQCVYGWSGASSEMLLRLQGTVTVLPQSHRLPRKVKWLADRILSRIRSRVAKEFAPRDAEGSVGWIGGPDRVDLTDGRTHLLLARSNYQLSQWRAIARKQGVIYTLQNGEWSWSLESVRAAYAWEALRRDEPVSRTELAKVNKFLDQKLKLSSDTHKWSDFYAEESRGIPWYQALTHMSPEDREYIRLIRRRGESLKKPGRVRIGTIHSVKGAEADHVAVLTDLTEKIELASRLDPDAEHRVMYVGVTRARDALSLVQPQTRRAYRF